MQECPDISPPELAKKIGEGLLSFPVTHFTSEFAFDEAPYREHISWLLEHDPAGLFAAGGTGRVLLADVERVLARW